MICYGAVASLQSRFRVVTSVYFKMRLLMNSASLHTLAQLESGELKGVTRLQIAENLTEFPLSILTLADTLEVLDLSNNQLSSLPDDFDKLTQLKIVFLSQNQFRSLPTVLARCPKLEMIGFKANQITEVAQHALPKHTRWLILTDNQISQLPESMGELTQLKKLALAGNKLTCLPSSMANCRELELVRLSANKLTALPDWLVTLPKLAWLAFAGNQFSHVEVCKNDSVPIIDLDSIKLIEPIGQGASGVIYRAGWYQQPNGFPAVTAVKMFKGAITSDGYPADELDCCLTTGLHNNLIKVIGQINQAGQLGLVMELIPAGFSNLGLPPSLVTCTRDTFMPGTYFDSNTILTIALQMSDTLHHMHQQHVSHGDVYAHNIMFNEQNEVLFGDFGAASNLARLSHLQQQMIENIEVRAFGCLVDDLLQQLNPVASSQDKALVASLVELSMACMTLDMTMRPSFKQITQVLQNLKSNPL